MYSHSGFITYFTFIICLLGGFLSVSFAEEDFSLNRAILLCEAQQEDKESIVENWSGEPAQSQNISDDEYGNVTEEQAVSGEGPRVADPLEPWNRAMYNFNDKVYVWLLRPAAEGYEYVLPEGIRGIFSSFYKNIKAPVRIINNLLQGKPGYAGIELAKFVINSTIGVAGFRDCATECFNIKGREADFGQTLGKYGMGHGFYFVWPFIGPSSARDSVGWGVDWTFKPTTYLGGSEWFNPENVGLYVHESVNTLSFHIGEYEALKGAAIDPYIAMRVIYIQYREKLLKE
jgi:phospholipid-binding lipoprotein MlaA